MFSSRRIVIAVLAITALVAAGCAGDTAAKNDYVEKNNAIQQEAAAAASAITVNANSKDSVAQLKKASADFAKSVAKLKALDAPEDWKDEHAKLVTSLEQQHDAMERSITAAEKGDVAAATAEITKITQYSKDSQDAIEAMNADR